MRQVSEKRSSLRFPLRFSEFHKKKQVRNSTRMHVGRRPTSMADSRRSPPAGAPSKWYQFFHFDVQVFQNVGTSGLTYFVTLTLQVALDKLGFITESTLGLLSGK